MPAWLRDLVRLSRREYYADFWITPPITFAMIAWSLHVSWSFEWLPFFVLGWFAWTAYEYATHRWLAHGSIPLMVSWHRMHHDRQRDYIAVPPWLTLSFYAIFAVFFGVRSTALAVGFFFGYVVYAALHTAFHYARIHKGHPLYRARWRHVMHHRFDDVCYGVTWSLWDRIMRTEYRHG